MIDFIDKTSDAEGTPLNRANMMGVQGFMGATTIFNPDGSITETFGNEQTLTTTFNSDGSITESFVGERTITKTTIFISGVINEVIE